MNHLQLDPISFPPVILRKLRLWETVVGHYNNLLRLRLEAAETKRRGEVGVASNVISVNPLNHDLS